MQIEQEYKKKVLGKLLEVRQNFDGSDSAFAKQWGINSSVYNQLKNGTKIDGLIKDNQWLNIGIELDISPNERVWRVARTEVFEMIEEDIKFCKEFSKSRICVADCGIGKTYTAKYLARTMKNVFYVDASQAKTKRAFIRLLAKTIGLESGKDYEMLRNIKYYLKMLPKAVVQIDEAGDLEYNAFLVLKELWNATENQVGWYLIGADGLKAKITRGIDNKKVGFREIFSRYSEKYTNPVPDGVQDKLQFYKRLMTDVLKVNMKDKKQLDWIVKKCLTTDDNGNIGGLRRAESLLIAVENYGEEINNK